MIRRLSQLSSLPAPVWKVHAGDLPHGEDVAIDDNSWELVAPGFVIPANKTAWFRASIEIPKSYHGYDLSDARIWFQFRTDETVTQIIYFNGRLVAAGEDLDPIVLADNVKGGRILVAVKLPQPSGAKLHFERSVMNIDFPASRPSPEELRQEFISASAIIASQSSDSRTERNQLEKAIATVNLEALDRGDQVEFDASLAKAQLELESLLPLFRKFTFHLVGNSHIDAAWLWPWTEAVEAVRRTFGTASQLMQEYPNYTFTQSTAQYSEWITEKYPYIDHWIRKQINEGRWEIVGGMWVEPDLNMPDGESLVRQLLVGTRYFKSQYGVDVHVGWNPDSFGYSWQLPQIYKRSGIDYFVTTKLNSNETHRLPFKLFWWQSPDGSKVLTYFPNGYGNDNLNPARLSTELSDARVVAPGLTELMDLYGVGDHGGGPTRLLLNEGMRWGQPEKPVPKMEFGTAESYFAQVERKINGSSPAWNYRTISRGYTPPPLPADNKVAIPTWKDELYYEFHRGVFTTQANHKRNMRESEERMLNTERYASFAWLTGDPYPATQLTEAWKKALFNQFHDLAAGSGIGVIYKEAEKDYEQVRCATNDISAKALDTISSEVNTRAAGEVLVMVFNPLAWNRSGLVAVDVRIPSSPSAGVSVLDGKDHIVASKVLSFDQRRNTYKLLLSVPDVPSMGYKVLHVVSGAQTFASDLKVSGLTLENASLRVTVDPKTGWITSLYDKKGNFETLASGGQGNQLQIFADNPKCCDAWNIDPGTLDHPNVIATADSVELVENDPLRATIRVTRTWQKSKFIQDVSLYAGADQVEVSNNIDWHETHTLLKVAFPLAVSRKFATYEIPYGTIDRPTTRDNSWEEAMFEVPALRWADLGDGQHGFSLINETKYGYDAKDNVLRLSLLRSPTSPDPGADQGQHRFSFSLYPHTGDWQQALTERRGYEYNYKLTAVQVPPHSGSLPLEYSYISLQPENVVLTAVKKAEDADGLILRMFESVGKSGEVRIRVPPGATSATITNLMEKPEGQRLKVMSDTVTVPIHPYEILSLRIDFPKR
ncbi:MAG TPA: glycoside hydrolase family 38 C-terminal domain-containing protein [Pyrinomonadaceae bacterium]